MHFQYLLVTTGLCSGCSKASLAFSKEICLRADVTCRCEGDLTLRLRIKVRFCILRPYAISSPLCMYFILANQYLV